MSYFYTAEEKSRLQWRASFAIASAWFSAALALWFYANDAFMFKRFFYLFVALLIIAKGLGTYGWAEYARSKGYSRWYGWLSFIPFLGAGLVIFLNDRWSEQHDPRLAIQRRTW